MAEFPLVSWCCARWLTVFSGNSLESNGAVLTLVPLLPWQLRMILGVKGQGQGHFYCPILVNMISPERLEGILITTGNLHLDELTQICWARVKSQAHYYHFGHNSKIIPTLIMEKYIQFLFIHSSPTCTEVYSSMAVRLVLEGYHYYIITLFTSSSFLKKKTFDLINNKLLTCISHRIVIDM